MAKPVVGAQLYSVREHLKTIPDIAKSLEKVAKAGYTAVQLSGVGDVKHQELVKVVNDSGLRVAATHGDWKRFLSDLDAVIGEHKDLGCSHLAIGGLPKDYFTVEGIKRFLDELAPVAERLARKGMDFSYHNHNHELTKFDGKRWLDLLYEQADPDVLKAEIDTYWIQAGGGDPAEWVRKCAGREPLLHLKDMIITPQREQRFAEIGEGNLNWPPILEAAEKGGVEYLLVEQDNCYGRDPFESLAISYANLKKWGYR
jgi:sugar phosphate isomerase/epimerase